MQLERGLWEVGHSEYHSSRTAISHSALETFRWSPALYRQNYLTTTPLPSDSAAFALGRALHVRLLEPEQWSKLVVVKPRWDARTKAGKIARESFERFLSRRLLDFYGDKDDLTVISADDEELVDGMVAGVLANPIAFTLLAEPGLREQAVRWPWSPATWLKCKFDLLTDTDMVVDVKTAADPSPRAFAQAAGKYGYHRQAALYQDGALQGLERSSTTHVYIVICKQPPHDCHVYRLGQRSLQAGRRQNELDLARLEQCRLADSWGVQTEIVELDVAAWAMTDAVDGPDVVGLDW